MRHPYGAPGAFPTPKPAHIVKASNEKRQARLMKRRERYHAKKRLEELREILRSESISWFELAELQGLAKYIRRDDVELLEPAGVPEVYITKIYDNGGRTVDRYTVYLNICESQTDPRKMACVAMSEDPKHPQGVAMHGTGYIGSHNGKRIKFEQLSQDCQDVLNELEYQQFPGVE